MKTKILTVPERHSPPPDTLYCAPSLPDLVWLPGWTASYVLLKGSLMLAWGFYSSSSIYVYLFQCKGHQSSLPLHCFHIYQWSLLASWGGCLVAQVITSGPTDLFVSVLLTKLHMFGTIFPSSNFPMCLVVIFSGLCIRKGTFSGMLLVLEPQE